MEKDDQYKAKLLAQLRDDYGKATYTYTCFIKYAEQLKNRETTIDVVQIILSSITTVGLVSILSVDHCCLKLISAFFSAASLALTLYSNRFRLSDDIRLFTQGSDELWKIRAEYISLLTDMEQLDNKTIAHKRDELLERTDAVYRKYPKTNSKIYKKAQDALKKKEEQFFSDQELDMMFPKHLRVLSSSNGIYKQ